MTTKKFSEPRPVLSELGKPNLDDGSFVFNNKLLNNPQVNVKDMHNMFKIDGQVSGLWRLLTTPLRSSKMKITRPNSRAKRETKFIEEVFFSNSQELGMNNYFSNVLSTIMRMLIDGWSPHEIVWKIVNGEVRVKKLAYRSIKNTEIKIDRYGEIESYTQKNDMYNGFQYHSVEIPSDKMLHFVFGAEWNTIFGRSLFLQSYYHYDKKHKLYYLAHMNHQIRALRLRILKSPQADPPERVEEVAKHVAKLGFNSTINLPDGYELTLPDLGSGDIDFLALIHHHDVQMSKSILSQVLDVGLESGSGSFNLSDTHLDIFLMNLGLIANSISNVINKDLIPKMIDWNFGTGFYPRLEFLPFDRQDKKFLANLFIRVAGSRTINISPELKIEIEKQISDLLKADIDFENITDRDIEHANKMKDLEVEKLQSEIDKNRQEDIDTAQES